MSGVVSVGVALGATAIAATDVAATGIAAMTLGTAFEVVGAVGATVGAVGAITKNKGLMFAGMALGAAGGIGAIADGAGVFGSSVAASATGTGMGAGEMAGQVGGTAENVATGSGIASTEAAGAGGLINGGVTSLATGPTEMQGQVQGANLGVPPSGVSESGFQAASGQPATNVLDSVAQGSNPTLSPDSVPQSQPNNPLMDQTAYNGGMGDDPSINAPGDPARTAGHGVVPPTAAATPPAGGTTPPAPNTGAAPPVPGQQQAVVGDQSGLQPTAGPYKATVDASGVGTVKGTPPTTDLNGNWWSGILDFVKKNPGLALGGLSAAGSFLAGATSPLTPAQVSALNAQATKSAADTRLADTQTALLSRQLANTSQPMPVAMRKT